MAAFRIYARVQQIGVKQFLAVASGVPEPPVAPEARAIVLTAVEPDLVAASLAKERMLLEVGAQIRARGGNVVDVEG